ncbi:MAG TPA: glycosyltransferase family 2 protein [bacterium]|nr:glycosyltransferase family 2 protein [bacterium]
MYKNKTIGVNVPAYNEEKLIGKVITTMPDFVDKIIIVNDCSTDNTKNIIENFAASDQRVVLINHQTNQGLGKSLIDGYLKSLSLNMDITVVMAGDAQMDPLDLPAIIEPIVNQEADYTKGNRLLAPNISRIMPTYRFIGNSFLTLLTKFATGYWHIIDPQSGYTAISKTALNKINISAMTPGYGYNADLLTMLNIANFKVKDVEIKPIYGSEKSKIKVGKYIVKISKLLTKLFFKRMWQKYFVREFHPLVFFYFLSFINLILIALPFFIRFLYLYFKLGIAPQTTLIIFVFTATMGVFSLFFGMWLDMEDNRRLKS